jgi:hypothetical protein
MQVPDLVRGHAGENPHGQRFAVASDTRVGNHPPTASGSHDVDHRHQGGIDQLGVEQTGQSGRHVVRQAHPRRTIQTLDERPGVEVGNDAYALLRWFGLFRHDDL